MRRTTLVLLALAAAWLIAVFALRQFLPCDPGLPAPGQAAGVLCVRDGKATMRISLEEQYALDVKHADDPQPGDYWEEHLCGICVVLAVDGGIVTLCRTKKDVDFDSWTWNLDKREAMSLRDFGKWLHYQSSGMAHKTWCHVHPQAHAWAIAE